LLTRLTQIRPKGPLRPGTPQNQRVRAHLLTSGGSMVSEQVQVFAATAAAPAIGGRRRRCEITIGEGGDFPELGRRFW
jgi:hypothetical protein